MSDARPARMSESAGSGVPAPSLADAGKVPAVKGDGTGYELVTLTPATLPFGAIYWSSSALTANEANVPVKVAGTTAAQGNAHEVTQATNNRLTYTGAVTRDFVAQATGGHGASNATLAFWRLYKNGAAIAGGSSRRTMYNNTDVAPMAVHAHVSLAQNDYVELWCETNDGDDLTFHEGALSIRAIN